VKDEVLRRTDHGFEIAIFVLKVFNCPRCAILLAVADEHDILQRSQVPDQIVYLLLFSQGWRGSGGAAKQQHHAHHPA
jgi:hypothetical protein